MRKEEGNIDGTWRKSKESEVQTKEGCNERKGYEVKRSKKKNKETER